MTAALSATDRALLEAVTRADVMDAAGRLLANPRRAMVSIGEQVAMAAAVERLQAVAIEADLLVRTLDLPETGRAADEQIKDHAVQTQLNRLRSELATMFGEETNNQTNRLETRNEQ